MKANGIPQIRVCDFFKYSDDFLTLKEFSEFQKVQRVLWLSFSLFFPAGLYVIQRSTDPDVSLIKALLIFLTPRKGVHNDTE